MTSKSELYSDTCIKVYDPNQQKVIGVFSNFRKAADKMCLTEKTLRGKATTKRRVYSKYYDMEVAVRLCTKQKGDDLLIDKTLKNQIL